MASLPSTPTTTSRPREKHVSFTTKQPEIIPAFSKRRKSSTITRPSWSSVFLLRDSRARDNVAARSRSLSPGPSILKEVSAFKSNASDAELKQDEDGVERKVHVSLLHEKKEKPTRGRKKALPIPTAKVSRNASPRALSPDSQSPREHSPSALSRRHASPREENFEQASSNLKYVLVQPPSPPASDDEDEDEDDNEQAIEYSDDSPTESRQSSVSETIDEADEMEAMDNSRFGKVNIDASSHAQRHEKRADSMSERKLSQSWRDARQSSYVPRSPSIASSSRTNSITSTRTNSITSTRTDSISSTTSSKPQLRRRSSNEDESEKYFNQSSIYGVRSRTPRLPRRLGTMRV